MSNANVRPFAELGLDDLEEVGGKNSSLGEMVSNLSSLGVRVPDGFATTADAFRRFIGDTGLAEEISEKLKGLDTDDTRALAEVGKAIRESVVDQEFPDDLEADIRSAYETLVDGRDDVSFAVRSSATAEDLPDASFAGQQETFLNIKGIDGVLQAIREVFASLYNDRAIAYRVHHDFDHDAVALSAGVQQMVRSDIGASGVMFTMDTESGFKDAVFVTSSYGLGEAVVQGAVNPDEFYVYKPALRDGRPAVLKRGVGTKATKMVYTDDPAVGKTTEFVDTEEGERRLLSLTDDEVEELARHALTIEEHYGRPMDIEWGKDGLDGELYVLQARPETVMSRAGVKQRFKMDEKGEVVVEGRAIGQKIGAGGVRVMTSIDEMHDFVEGEVLVADMTDPDWEPIMKRASAIVTNRGGRTCHAAIIARELGIPAVVGTGDATRTLEDGREVTVSCAEGDTGYIYDGTLKFTVEETELTEMPEIAHQDHDERRHAGAGVLVRDAAQRRRRPGPAGVHHQPADRHPPQGAARPRRPRAAAEVADRGVHRGVRRAAGVLRAARRRRCLDDRGRVRAQPGDRADERLQVQRVRQPRRRRAVRARRGEPDDRLPRRLAVSLRGVRRLLRDGGRGAEVRARRDGPDQRQDHDPVRAHGRRGQGRDRPARRSTDWSAARTTSRS